MTPDQHRAIARFRESDRIAHELAETKAHAALGLPPVMDDETTLALETALIPHRS